MKEQLKTLCAIAGVSGREEAVREYIIRQLEATETQKDISVDPLGNVICHLHGKHPCAKKVMFCAHMDEVGLIITYITKEGYLRFSTIGGIDAAVLCGKTVKIGEITGVIGCKAIHLCRKEEAEKQPKIDDLLIDIGASDKETAEKLVKCGDFAVFNGPFTEIQELCMAKALDDRVGCALLLQMAQQTPPYDITLVFTVQEEVGLRGATVATYTVRPDIAVVVETTTAADIANVSEDKQVCKVGAGPVVSFMDKSTLYDANLYQLIREIADQNGIPNQTKTVVAGGNDAAAVQKSAGGVRVAAVSLPCRYLHSPSCVISMQDMEYTKQLLLKLQEVLPQ